MDETEKATQAFRETCIETVTVFLQEMDMEDAESLKGVIKLLRKAQDFDELEGIMANELGYDDVEMITDLYRDALRDRFKQDRVLI